MERLKATTRFIDSVGRICNIVLFSIMVLASFMQVLNRNIFQLPLSWLEEASKFSMIIMTFIGTEMGLRDGSQIAVTGIVDKFKGKAKIVVDLISRLFVVLISVAIAIGAFALMKVQIASGQLSPTLHIPMWVPYLIMFVTFSLTIVLQVITSIVEVHEKTPIKGEIK